MRKFFGLLLLAATLSVQAQDLSKDYTPIQFTGKIPDDFLKDMREITQAELNNRGSELTKKQGYDYFANSNYVLRDLYLSGYVYFNDTLSEYVNTTAQQLLKHIDQKEAANLRFYVTKFSIPNALSWRSGTILINIGLFDYIETEAQLAFILGHEITHYLEQHSLNMYVLKRKLEKRKERKKLDLSAVIKDKNMVKMVGELKYSQSQEFGADMGGLELFLKTNFDPNEAAEALQNLVYIDSFPPQKVQLDINSLFSNSYYTVDSAHLWGHGKDETLDVMEEDEDDGWVKDTLSTHPSLSARIKKVKDKVAETDTTRATVKNMQSEEKLAHLKKIVAFEKLNYYFSTGNYEMALYRSLTMQKKYPDNIYLKEMTANSLFWITYYDTYGYDDAKTNAKSKVYTNFEYMQFYLNKVGTKGLGKLTLAYVRTMSEKYPENYEFQVLLGRILELTNKESDARSTYKSFTDKKSPHYNFVNERQKRK